MGNINKIQGFLGYGGRLRYMPQKLWFRRASIKDNILLGLPENRPRLQLIYKTVMLT